MGKVIDFIKKTLGNKNTVTILVVLAGVIVIWYIYQYNIKQAITTVSVPYALTQVDAGTAIDTESGISYKQITKATIKNTDIVTNIGQLKGKYICLENSVPENGFFYLSQLCDQKDIEDTVLSGIEDGYTAYILDVDNTSTYANSIMPGSYIDLYLQAVDNGKILYGCLIESIQVLAVFDSSGKDVFWSSNAGNSRYLYFAVSDEYNSLLKTAELINGYSLKITPVPRSSSYSKNPGETKIGSKTLYNFIMSKQSAISD